MAMRKPDGGAGADAPRRETWSGFTPRVFEDFKPSSEWKQDNDSHILNIHLPGFIKDQIKASAEGRTIRVSEQRQVFGNKWVRFLEVYNVPDNGNMTSIRAKLQGENLIVTFPKLPQNDVHAPQKDTDVPKQPTPTSTSQQTHQKGPEPNETSVIDHPTVKKGHQDDLKQPSEKGSNDQINKNDEGDREVNPSRHPTEKISDHDSKEKNTALEKPDDVVTKTMAANEPAKAILQKDGTIGAIHDKNSKEALDEEQHKKIGELNVERRFLVNIGVALLVIVALTAQLTYNICNWNM